MNLYEAATPFLFALDPERAHGLSIRAAKAGLHPRFAASDPRLATRVAGLEFAHPLGLAAGYDKGAEVPEAMWASGFGHVEVGTVTPRPQPGNPRPRVFRLTDDRAVINRYGFNSEGLDAVRARLEALGGREGVLGVNVGANKASEDFAADYVEGARTMAPVADYLTVNVSSPNTPGLRALQGAEPLADLVARVLDVSGATPVFLKIAPDLDESELDTIARIADASGLAGLVVSNTTLARPRLVSRHRDEAGGLSGRPLFDPSTRVLAGMFRRTRLPLVGVGGVEDARTAWAKIEAGASLVQLYSAMVYRGPGLAAEIVRGLSRRCAEEDVNVADVVGRAAETYANS